MPLAVARFRERHPGVELSLCPADPDDALRLLRAGESDIALDIAAAFTPRADADLDVVELLDDPMYIMLHRDHPLAGRTRIKLADLQDESWMIGTTATCPDTSIFLTACQAVGFTPNIAFNLDDYTAIQGFVAAGMGVSFIPDLALVALRDDVVVRSFGARPPVRRIVAATLRDSFRSPAKQAMLDVLLEVAAEFGVGRSELALAS
jgi:DNA-binding transcriptional LysR family regulator